MDDQQPGFTSLVMDRNAPLDERLKSSGISSCSVTQFNSYIQEHGFSPTNFVFHAGWFQHTLPALAPAEPIALLRLDGDLYESTIICLDALYHKVSPGGIVIIDDYALGGCYKAVHEFLDKHGLKPAIQRVPNELVVYWEKTD